MKREKEEALKDFMNMISDSWTYGKMTLEERFNCGKAISPEVKELQVKGTYKERWHQLQAIYHAYLLGLGYDGPNWRD